jgi:hypothetical protein
MVISDSITADDFRREAVAEIDRKLAELFANEKRAKPRRAEAIRYALLELTALRAFYLSIHFNTKVF